MSQEAKYIGMTAIFVIISIALAAILFNISRETALNPTVIVCTRDINPAPKEWCDSVILKEVFETNKLRNAGRQQSN